MEKVYIKPNAQEIIIKGAVTDGHMDIFAYDPSDDQTKKLGHLFILGHVQHETDDMAYAINLISALAKREYYSKLTASPKEAFSSTLKKVNEVVEEFFEHKGVKINIGIFAIAGEQMYISKLGKFKILLARDDKTIDVLNNIMFDKETVQEKQFSSVISGLVQANDRILAYYPSKTTLSRERYLKMYLHKYEAPEFMEQLKSIKKEKDAFSCAMVYIKFDKMKEVAVEPRVQPQELTPAQLTVTTNLGSAPRKARVESKKESPSLVAASEPVKPTIVEPVAIAGKESVKELVTTSKQYAEADQEVPRIIATEFSLGKKDNFMNSTIHRFRFNHLTPKKKAVLSLIGVVLVLGVSFGVQSFFGTNPEVRELNAAIKTAQERLELAKTKMSQNDTPGAREILNSSLASLTASEQTNGVRNELQQLLDEVDQVQDADTSLIAHVETDQGQITQIKIGKSFFAYTKVSDDSGKLLVLENGAIKSSKPAENTRPAMLVTSSKGTPVLIDIANQKTVAIKDSGPEVAVFSLPQPVVASYFYEDNLYMTDGTGIFKAADVFQGDVTAKTWLKQNDVFPSDTALIAVDGDIYIMTKQGMLITYFRGEKKSEVATTFSVGDGDLLLTNADGPSLYLFSKNAGRIYVFDKKTGTLLKTFRIGTENPLVTATVDAENVLYFVTQDNKIWKIVQ